MSRGVNNSNAHNIVLLCSRANDSCTATMWSKAELNLISHITLFNNISDPEHLQKLLSIAHRKVYPAKTIIVNQGQDIQGVFIILTGELEAVMDGVVIQDMSLTAGGIIGEVAFFGDQRHMATASTKVESELLILPSRALSDLIQSCPDLGLKIYKGFTSALLSKFKGVTQQVLGLKFGDSALRVAHDIRSPIAALKALARSSNSLDAGEQRLIEAVIDRIDQISISLFEEVNRNKVSRLGDSIDECSDSHEVSVSLIHQTIQAVVAEKRIQYLGSDKKLTFEVDSECQESKALYKIKVSDLGRIVSNLVDNSYEAILKDGFVKITLIPCEEGLKLRVMDNGSGIPSNIISSLGSTRLTHGKKNGNGFGLLHAFEIVKSWGGEIVLESEPSRGTSVMICLPFL